MRCFGKTAEIMGKYLSKGSQVGVEGHIQTGSYTNKEGQKVYTTDVIVDSFDFVGSKSSSAETAATAANTADDFMKLSGIDESELPFA